MSFLKRDSFCISTSFLNSSDDKLAKYSRRMIAIVSSTAFNTSRSHASRDAESTIDYNRDFNFDYFGFKTLEKSYLQKINENTIERTQDMIMRVALSIHRNNLGRAFETYNLMSRHYFTHATPTLYNAGSKL